MFRHIGIVVNDMGMMSKFYLDLGFEIIYDEIEEGSFLQHITGLKDAKAHIIKLGKGGQTIVELLDFGFSSERPLGNELFHAGLTHFAITIPDCEKVIRLFPTIINTPMISPDGKVKVAFGRDPEGNFVELVETLS
jgi:catechol-2,3-dioxygenase